MRGHRSFFYNWIVHNLITKCKHKQKKFIALRKQLPEDPKAVDVRIGF